MDHPPLEESHTPDAVAERLQSRGGHSDLRDFVYGAVDGAVTTFAVVAGVAGAELSPGIVIVLGFANLVGDGFSMAAATYLGVRAEAQLRERYRRREELHIRVTPEGEREEIRQIYRAKGFTGEDLERAVDITTGHVDRWVDTMLVEEYGLPLQSPRPRRAAWTVFTAFASFGLIPILPYLVAHLTGWPARAFLASALATGAAFLAVGALKGRFVSKPAHTSALETLAVGGVAAALAWLVGLLLRGIADAA